MLKKYVFIQVLLVIITTGVLAEEHGAKPQLVEGIEHIHHSHHAGIFLGVTSNLETEHNDFSIGIDYEYRLPVLQRIFGIGVMGEAVFSEEAEYIAGIPVYIHLTDFLRLFAAPSMLFVHETEVNGEHGEGQVSESKTKYEYLTIAGLFIDIETRNFTISPTVKFEFIGGHISVAYGLTFAKAF